MTESWQRLWEVFHATTELPAAEREEFVVHQCTGNDELAAAVLDLLKAHEDHHAMLEEPVVSAMGLVDELDPESLIGESIDKYVLRSVIGEGGMGIVYEAEQSLPVERRVALKVIRLGMNTREVVSRFKQEQQALALMTHANVARVYDAGATADGRPYFVMELVNGAPITHYCDGHQLDTHERLELCMQLLDGIHHAHQKGLIHRDIKPSNVLVEDGESGSPTIKIIDFGIAKATDQRSAEHTMFTAMGRLIGTPAYMSPEQAGLSDKDVDIRTDIYSIAALLYELLTGTTPFENDTLLSAGYAEMQRVIREQQPPLPSRRLSSIDAPILAASARARNSSSRALPKQVQGDLDWIVMKGLEKEPARRYGTATEFAADIRHYLGHLPVDARPPGTAYRLRKFVQRHTWGVGVSTLAIVALVAFAGFSAWQSRQLAVALNESQIEQTKAGRLTTFFIQLLSETEPNNAQGDEVTVLEALQRGAERLKTDLDEEPETKAAILIQMAEIYRELGDYQNSEQLLIRAEQSLNSLDATAVDAQIELHHVFANVLQDMGAHERAAVRYEQTITALRLHAPADRRLVRSLKDLGNLFIDTGDYASAIETQTEAVTLGRRVLDTGDPLLGTTLGNLAHAYSRTGDTEKSRDLFEESIQILRALESNSAMELATILSGFATLLTENGEFDEATAMHQEVVAIYRKLLGEAHPYLASSLVSLASAYNRGGRSEKAIETAESAVAMNELLFEGPHPNKANAYYQLAATMSVAGRYAEAESGFRGVLEVDLATLGEDHPYVFSDYEQLAVALSNQSKYNEAESYQRRALEGRIRVLGDDHPDTAASWMNLSSTLSRQDRLPEAIETAQRAVQILEGDERNNLRVTAARSQLGHVLYAANRFDESEAVYQEILESDRATLPDNHPNLGRTLHGLGTARLSQGKPSVAILEEAYAIRLEAHGLDHPHTALTLDALERARAAQP